MLLDLHTPGWSSVRFGDSFCDASDTSSLTALQYNYYPSLEDRQERTAKISRLGSDGPIKLELHGADGDYLYEGSEGSDDYTLVLLGDEGKDTFTIERLDASWALNLYETPSEKDSKILAERHQQLAIFGPSEASRITDEEVDEEEPDSDNPFHWRHYFMPGTPSVAVAAVPVAAASSPAHTPMTTTNSRQSTPLMRPNKKAVNPMLPNQRRSRQAQGATAEPQHKRGRSDTAVQERSLVPEVRVGKSVHRSNVPPLSKRKAAVEDIVMGDFDPHGADTEDAETDHNKGLVLDDASLRQSKATSRRTLEVQATQGPISLRSAASSPGSRNHSPAPPQAFHHDAVDDDHMLEDVEEEDGDVEVLRIPSPALIKEKMAVPSIVTTSAATKPAGRRVSMQTPMSARRKSVHSADPTATVEMDEDDDLEAGLMEAMMADEADETAPGHVVAADEEEESEEE